MKILFYISAFIIFYSYVLFPIFIFLVVKIKRSTRNEEVLVSKDDVLPSVAVVIAAYNEEAHITERIENLLELDYPEDKIRFYIGSDGSTDNTNYLAKKFSDDSVRFFPFSQRRGKASVLNYFVDKTNEEIIVFSDANTNFEKESIKLMVSSFVDNVVGGVCGELRILSKAGNTNLDSLYWKYERFIKECEGGIGSLLGANGAIYAIRKVLYEPIPADTVVDDFYIGMSIVKNGFRFDYLPQAIALEYEPEDQKDEFRRRVRIGMGNYQAFMRLKYFLNPFNSFKHTFVYISHKVFRWFTPHLMLIMLITSLILMANVYFLIAFLLQLIMYIFTWCIIKTSSHKKLPKTVSLIVFFISMNVALFMGFIKYISQNVNPAWERTIR